MLKLTSLMIILFSINTFASTNGGGVLMRNFSAQVGANLMGGSGGGGVLNSPEIVFNMGQKDGLVQFAYGHFEGNQWQIQKIQVPTAELTLSDSDIQALETSKSTGNWVFLK